MNTNVTRKSGSFIVHRPDGVDLEIVAEAHAFSAARASDLEETARVLAKKHGLPEPDPEAEETPGVLGPR